MSNNNHWSVSNKASQDATFLVAQIFSTWADGVARGQVLQRDLYQGKMPKSHIKRLKQLYNQLGHSLSELRLALKVAIEDMDEQWRDGQ